MIIVMVEARDEEYTGEVEDRLYEHLESVVNDLQVANAQFVDIEMYLVEDNSVEFLEEEE